jgi:glycerophosphoryl diester phosphodiesterase
MYLVAHRGLQSKNTKENTLAAIKLGNKNPNIHAVEIDVRLTKDNEVVVIHDKDIDRTSNGKGMVREMSLERLKRFNFGSFLKRTSISTLEEVLKEFSDDTLLIIELKDELNRNILLSTKVLEIINNYPNLNIWFKSFSKEIVLYLKEKTNRPVGALVNQNHLDNLFLNMDFYSISKKIINKEMLDDKIKQNKPIMVWTINTNEDLELLKNNIGKYVDNLYIISDNPLIYCK